MTAGNNLQADPAAFLVQQIGDDPRSLRRIHQYYLPVFAWLQGILSEKNKEDALIVGISGQQGCGKSTLCRHICELFKNIGKGVATFSIDDFYLSNKQQQGVARKYPGNPYLQPRGYPGTHDIDLAVRTLVAARGLKKGERMLLPRYDKSAFAGQGDRYRKARWPEITGPVDLILFEGWMLGFSSKPELTKNNRNMLQINDFLKKYGVWNDLLDAFLHLDSDRLENVIKWRVEAEMNMKAAGQSGMTQAETEAYTRLFIPCYEIYVPRLRVQPPVRHPYLRLELSVDRLPTQSVSVF